MLDEWLSTVNAEAMLYGPGHPEYENYTKKLAERYRYTKMLADELKPILEMALSRYEQPKDRGPYCKDCSMYGQGKED